MRAARHAEVGGQSMAGGPAQRRAGGPICQAGHAAPKLGRNIRLVTRNKVVGSLEPDGRLKFLSAGKVYVGTSDQLDVYGLLSSAPVATPTILPASKSFTGTVTVTLADTTPNAAIYYTTNGTNATTASTLYTGPFAVNSSKRINAIAAVSGVGTSSQAFAMYSLLHTAPPVFGSAADAYPGPQSVAISDATPGAVIYYTTNGSNATTSSTIYSGPIAVNTTETINAMAQAPGYSNSTTESATYTIASSSTVIIGDSAGFTSTAGLSFVGNSTLTNNSLQLSVVGKGSNANAVWYTTPLNVQAFTTDFYFQETLPTANGAVADGFTFTMQNAPAGVYAVGGVAGGLGYQGLTSSVAVKFDVYDNAGEGTDSTGFYQGGAAPTIPALDMTTSGVFLLSPDTMHAHLTYDGMTLTLLLTDVVTGSSFTASSAINIPSVVGGNTAYVGFTAGAHGLGLTQDILNWSYVAAAGTSGVATPTFSPAPGVYASPQSVSIGDATSGHLLHHRRLDADYIVNSVLRPGYRQRQRDFIGHRRERLRDQRRGERGLSNRGPCAELRAHCRHVHDPAVGDDQRFGRRCDELLHDEWHDSELVVLGLLGADHHQRHGRRDHRSDCHCDWLRAKRRRFGHIPHTGSYTHFRTGYRDLYGRAVSCDQRHHHRCDDLLHDEWYDSNDGLRGVLRADPRQRRRDLACDRGGERRRDQPGGSGDLCHRCGETQLPAAWRNLYCTTVGNDQRHLERGDHLLHDERRDPDDIVDRLFGADRREFQHDAEGRCGFRRLLDGCGSDGDLWNPLGDTYLYARRRDLWQCATGDHQRRERHGDNLLHDGRHDTYDIVQRVLDRGHRGRQ